VDVYDALATERPYKPALSTAQALETLREEVAPGWWDAGVHRELCELVASQPSRAAGVTNGRLDR
jgi:HD-GYP domain-containing protein (c-di-GMP phosphodiesterase class II)